MQKGIERRSLDRIDACMYVTEQFTNNRYIVLGKYSFFQLCRLHLIFMSKKKLKRNNQSSNTLEPKTNN